jgi:hypothetical protein
MKLLIAKFSQYLFMGENQPSLHQHKNSNSLELPPICWIFSSIGSSTVGSWLVSTSRWSYDSFLYISSLVCKALELRWPNVNLYFSSTKLLGSIYSNTINLVSSLRTIPSMCMFSGHMSRPRPELTYLSISYLAPFFFYMRDVETGVISPLEISDSFGIAVCVPLWRNTPS